MFLLEVIELKGCKYGSGIVIVHRIILINLAQIETARIRINIKCTKCSIMQLRVQDWCEGKCNTFGCMIICCYEFFYSIQRTNTYIIYNTVECKTAHCDPLMGRPIFQEALLFTRNLGTRMTLSYYFLLIRSWVEHPLV